MGPHYPVRRQVRTYPRDQHLVDIILPEKFSLFLLRSHFLDIMNIEIEETTSLKNSFDFKLKLHGKANNNLRSFE